MKTGLHLIITLQPYKTTVAYTDCAQEGSSPASFSIPPPQETFSISLFSP